MLDRLTRIQLSIFAIVTVLTVGAISIFYLHVPAALGIGSYNVNANFVAGGGLYQNANVTYRGVTVGRVESVGLTNDGVVARHAAQQRHSGAGERHRDGQERVRGRRAVHRPGAARGRLARDAAQRRRPSTRTHTAIGQDISGLLTEADKLVSSVGNTRLQDLLRETFKAFNGSGPELARLIQSSRLLVDEANANYGQITQLIDQAGPFLDAQIRSGDDIKSLADGSGPVHRRSRQRRPAGAVGAADRARRDRRGQHHVQGIRPTFPVLAANLANFGRIGVIYRKSLEQALVIFPALMAALITVGGGVPADEGGKLDFKIDLSDPPPCSTGFIPPTEIRSPADTTLRDLPTDLYCKTAQNDPAVVRGARNYPCQEFPGKRAPTIQLCRDPKGYVPIGSNPWRGPPVPYGTPVEDPRMTLAA